MSEQRPAPTRRDHETFCTTEGWAERKRADGRRGTQPVNYELDLPDGRVLFTRISHPVNRTAYGPSVWSHILRDQLEVTNDEFWACVDQGTRPDRGGATPPPDAIPAGVIRTLVREAHIPETEVRALTKEQAIARLAKFYTTGQ